MLNSSTPIEIINDHIKGLQEMLKKYVNMTEELEQFHTVIAKEYWGESEHQRSRIAKKLKSILDNAIVQPSGKEIV